MNNLNYKIIATGSKGNCVIIENIMIDIGVAFKSIENELKNIKYILITHIHSDHLNSTTFKNIKKKFPHIRIYGNYEVANRVGRENITKMMGDSTCISLSDKLEIQSFKGFHDVEVLGFVIVMGNKNIIYATDTYSLEEAPKLEYDYLFLESNYDENIVNKLMNKRSKYGYDVFESAKRHLSTQQSKAFYYMHRRDKQSKWIELHQSGRFY